MNKIPKDGRLVKFAFTTSNPFSPFEVVDMGKRKIVVNEGIVTFGSNTYLYDSDKYTGEIKPQKMVGGETDEDALLEVAVGDIVCLVINGLSDSTQTLEIKKIVEANISSEESALSDGKIFRLAKVVAEEVDGDFVWLNLQRLIKSDIMVSSGGGTAAGYIPWKPSFFTEGSEEAPVYKCRFNLGTINEVAATNWNDPFTLPSDEDTIKFVVATITTGSGKVTAVSLAVDPLPPTEDFIAKDTPPLSFKVVLGAIGRSSAKMIRTTNLTALAGEIFRETRTAPATGQEPFSRWWRWNISEP